MTRAPFKPSEFSPELSEPRRFVLATLDRGPMGEPALRRAILGAGFTNGLRTIEALKSQRLIRWDSPSHKFHITLEADAFRVLARTPSSSHDEWVE